MSRFIHLTELQLKELSLKQTAKNTNLATSNAVKTFLAFCQELNIFSINVIEKELLRDTLSKFYAGCRTEKTGELYKINSMHHLQNGLQRHFMTHRQIDIINDTFFTESNAVFYNMLSKIKSSGKGLVKHYVEIEPEDLSLLYKSINIHSPSGLLEKVWLDIMFHFIRRGRENLREMDRASFGVDTDAAGKRYVYQQSGEVDKNHRNTDGQFETSGEGRMYETGSELCPVNSYNMYISKLNPKQNAFWQRPKDKFNVSDDVWYTNAPLGAKTLGNLMATLSSKYQLSQRYTNHCIRVTSMQALDDANIEGRHIVRISGHKNEHSIKSYARTLSSSRKRNISSILSEKIHEDKNESSDNKRIKSQNVVTQYRDSPSTSTSDSSGSTIDFSFDCDDDDAFNQIPDALLNNNVSVRPFKHPHTPIFNNCNVTINYNYYHQQSK